METEKTNRADLGGIAKDFFFLLVGEILNSEKACWDLAASAG